MITLLLSFIACGAIDNGDPLIEAHRGGAALWPENSLAAFEAAVARGDDGVEFDLVVTADGVAVLSHDPTIRQETCTTIDGAPVDEVIYVKDLTLDELQSGYLCGALPDVETPNAQLDPAPMPTFAEALDVFAQDPDLLLHLDLKYEPGQSPPPEDMARAFAEALRAADLPNPAYASANLPEILVAMKAELPELPISFTTPRFPPGESAAAIALKSELLTATGVHDLIDQARAIDAEGLCMPYQTINRQTVELAQQAGLDVQIWTLNSERLLHHYSKWPVMSLITDDPGLAP